MIEINFRERMPLSAYAAKTSNRELLKMSSSGGVFTELATNIINAGGVVFGAAWDDKFNVIHKGVDTLEGLSELRGSKYVQSDLRDSISLIKRMLVKGRKVMFTGTPCQCAAVRLACGEDRNLLVCGLICHSNIPSDVWQKYLSELKCLAKDKIKAIQFRDKRNGWERSTFSVKFERRGELIACPLFEDIYAKIFFAGLAARNSCLSCKFKKGAHGADLVIGDFWGVRKTNPDLYDPDGVSVVLLYTKTGEQALCKSSLTYFKVSYDDIVSCNPYLERALDVEMRDRERFQNSWRRMSLQKAYLYAIEGPLITRITRRVYNKVMRVRWRIAQMFDG